MDGPATLTTRRLQLRPLGPDDAGAIVDGLAEWDVVRWLAVVPFPYGRADADTFLASPEAAPGRAWAICDSGGVRGVVSLGEELGYWLARSFWGRGYVPEAASAVIDAAFADPARSRLTASHMLGNDRSARALETLGMRATGLGKLHFRALGRTLPVRRMEMTRNVWRRLRDSSRSSIAGSKETVT